MRVYTMKMMRFAAKRARAFTFDNFTLENKANSAYNFLCYCEKRIDRFLHGLHSYRL